MIIAVGFLLPLLIYFLLYFFVPRAKLGKWALGVAAFSAVASSAAVLYVVYSSRHWPEGTQVAWTGVSAAGRPLVVGGAQEEATIGWPNGSFAPYFKTTADAGYAALEIKDGGAFVREDQTLAYLNGTPLQPGGSHTLGGYTIRLVNNFSLWPLRLRFWLSRAEILDGRQNLVASFALPSSGKDRVYALDAFIEKFSSHEAADAALVNEAVKWGAEVRLLVTGAGEVRVLDGAAARARCQLPCSLSLLWTDVRLSVRLKQEEGRLALNFLPPWRHASPLPPPQPSGQMQLTVTGHARPGDYAFLLPLGNGIGGLHRDLRLDRPAGRPPVFAAQDAAAERDRAEDKLPVEILPRAPGREEPWGGDISRISVPAGNLAVMLSVVKNLPLAGHLFWLFAVALICFVAGLALAYLRMPSERMRWVVFGVAAFFWNILSLRVLLALRYALSPSHLDDLAVKGVTIAFVGLGLIPGLLLFAARLRCDVYEPVTGAAERKARFTALGYLGLLIVALNFMYMQAPYLWDRVEDDWWFRLPERMVTRMGWWHVAALVLVSLYLLALVLVLYRDESRKLFPRLWQVFVSPLAAVEFVFEKSRTLWELIADPRNAALPRWLNTILLAILLFVLVPLGLAWLGGRLFQEIGAPLLLCWPFAAFWLASKVCFGHSDAKPDERPRPTPLRAFLCAAVTLVPPAFVLPVFIRDSGSVLATLAIFFPLVLLLLVSVPRRYGLIAFATLAAAFLAAALLLYSNLLFYVPGASQLSGETGVRLLNFRRGADIPRTILVAERDEGGPRGLPMQKLRNGYQHTRENEAMAHEGGWSGLGFGNAQTRRSQIRQDTLQYDSVFSFFLLSEYGVIGGASLLLLYAFPLGLFLVSAKARFDYGHGLAVLIACALLVEALLHAGMNVSAFPFTGRNLPVLSVISNTDLPRWTFLFLFAVLGVFFRHRGQGRYTDEAASVASDLRGAEPLSEERPHRFATAAAAVLLFPALLAAAVGIRWVGVHNDRTLDQPVGWEETLAAVTQLIEEGRLYVHDQQTLELKFRDDQVNILGGEFIEEERLRFNALPREEKVREFGLATFNEGLRGAAGLEDYNKLLARLRWMSPIKRKPHVSLFRLVANSDGQTYSVEANADFNTQVSFGVSLTPEDCARVTFRGDHRPIIGPAWVMGEWTKTYDAAAPLPWIEHLANALDSEWKRLRSEQGAAAKRYGTLSLDGALQRAAVGFTSEKGRELYQQLLADNQKSARPSAVLPPRVALAVLALPNGEVVAMGGWPRMASGALWRRDGAGREWIPPSKWIEDYAPRSLARRYGGDRNYDPMVVGSATKPMWAAAALSLHPGLDRVLLVRGADEREGEVFGVGIAEAADDPAQDQRWDVTERQNWVNFENYLALSDNRYHVRLGFLGLAEDVNGNVRAAGPSGSAKESLDGKSPWGRVPAFPPELGFSAERPQALEGLHLTPLARRLREYFGVEVSGRGRQRRLSFWTKDRRHDATGEGGRPVGPSALFDSVSPPPVNLALDTIKSPRDFVSVLLGGKTNLWPNVDLAAAFGSCLSGRPVVPHVVSNDLPVAAGDGGKSFAEAAARILPGLEAVVLKGTASEDFKESGALEVLQRLRGFKVYAKTGTLQAERGQASTSRIVLAVVRWEGGGRSRTPKGLVFSVVGERAQMRTASKWLAEFLVKHQNEIRQLLDAPGGQVSKP